MIPVPLAIGVSGVGKTYGRGSRATRALEDIWLGVRAGRITGLIGPNGAGKSTLIHIMLGLVRSDAGECSIFGLPAGARRARIGVGFLPEEVSYEADFKIGEILRLHSRLARASDRSEVAATWARIGTGAPLSRRFARCSLGTARRLALACALLGRPRLLVLDEPTSGMDPAARERLHRDLVRFRGRGGTVLLSSHVLSELEAVCDDIVVLERGRVVHAGELRGLRSNEALQIRVRGMPLDRLSGCLGSGWSIRRDGDDLVARTEVDRRSLGELTGLVESQGGRIVALRRGSTLGEIYRRRTEE